LISAGGLGRCLAALALTAALAGCATLRSAATPPAAEARPVRPDADPRTQAGRASWYGAQHQGRRTASGESFDMYQLTAAHPTLPLGTRVLVTNLRNGRSVEVRVNDRGPVVDGRIIDLSYAAARELDAVSDGVIPVRLRVLSP
jgi:rare lipoprotein A